MPCVHLHSPTRICECGLWFFLESQGLSKKFVLPEAVLELFVGGASLLDAAVESLRAPRSQYEVHECAAVCTHARTRRAVESTGWQYFPHNGNCIHNIISKITFDSGFQRLQEVKPQY